jgi:hypothetical protein
LRIGTARGGADELQQAEHGEHRSGAAAQPCARLRGRCKRLQQQRGGEQQRAPAGEHQRRRQQRLHRPQCDTEQQQAEEALDVVHPRAGTR